MEQIPATDCFQLYRHTKYPYTHKHGSKAWCPHEHLRRPKPHVCDVLVYQLSDVPNHELDDHPILRVQNRPQKNTEHQSKVFEAAKPERIRTFLHVENQASHI